MRVAPAWRGALLIVAILLSAVPANVVRASENRLQAFDGAAPPPFTLARLDGGTLSPQDEVGHVALVHFFATWCEPCRPELASLDALARDAKPRGLRILAVDVGEVPARVARYFTDSPVRFPILLDQDRRVTKAWDIHALPSTIVLDRAGRARLAVRGDLDWGSPDVRAALEPLLADSADAAKTPITAPERKP